MQILVDVTLLLITIALLAIWLNYLVIVKQFKKCYDYILTSEAKLYIKLYCNLRQKLAFSKILNRIKKEGFKNLPIQERLTRSNLRFKMFSKKMETFPFTFYGVITLLFCFFLLYFLIPYFVTLHSKGDIFVTKIGIKTYLIEHETTIYYVIHNLTKILSVVFSVILTLYIFTYRVRRTFTVSLNNFNNSNVSFLILLLTVIYGNSYFIQLDPTRVFDSYISINKISILSILLFISFVIVLNIIKGLLLSIDFGHTVEKSLENVDELTYISAFIPMSITVKERKFIEDYVIKHIEGLNQMIRYCVDNDLNNHILLIDKWGSILDGFKTGPDKSEVLNSDKLFYLSGNGDEDRVYKIFMNTQVSLIIYLAENNRYAQSVVCINHLSELLSPPKEFAGLKNIYLSRLHRLYTIANAKYSVIESEILYQISKYASIEMMSEKFISIDVHTDIMTKEVEKGDIKKLSNLAYSMLESTEIKNRSTIQNSKTDLDDKMLVFLMDKLGVKEFNRAYLFAIFQVCLKAIEVGNSQAVGFLLKFIVTNFHRTKEIKLVFNKVQELKGKRNPFVQLDEKDSEYFNQFTFKTNADQYCLCKLSILLFGQQLYSDINNLPKKVKENPSRDFYIELAPVFENVFYFDYVFAKIMNAVDEFGLYFLKETTYIRALKKIIQKVINGDDSYFHDWCRVHLKEDLVKN